MFDEFIQSRLAACRSPKTIRSYEDAFLQFERYLDGREPTGKLAMGWMSEMRGRGLSKATIASRGRALRIVSKYYGYGWKIPLPRLDRPSPNILSIEEVAMVLDACQCQRDRTLVITLWQTGIRKGECLSMTWQDVDLASGRMEVCGKTGRRTVYLTPLCAEALQRLQPGIGKVWRTKDGGELTLEGLTAILKRLEHQTGIRCNSHKWRRTSATALANAGAGPSTLMQALGWSSIAMATHYVRPDEASLRRFQQAAFGG